MGRVAMIGGIYAPFLFYFILVSLFWELRKGGKDGGLGRWGDAFAIVQWVLWDFNDLGERIDFF